MKSDVAVVLHGEVRQQLRRTTLANPAVRPDQFLVSFYSVFSASRSHLAR